MIFAVALFCLLLSWLLTGAMRRYALAARILDVPNDRSSHTQPTPRGGGVAIVCSFYFGLMALLAWIDDRSLVIGLTGAGICVAMLGFLDDRASLPARWRFLGHVLAAAWCLWWLGRLPPVPAFGLSYDLGPVATLLAAAYVVWMINLFNFMDGIDGIAGAEAITVTLGGAFVWAASGEGNGWVAAGLLASCVAGFLAWNFPPARIFMGDAGSGFLGLAVAALSLWCAKDVPRLFWCWFVLVGCFMVDATATLLRRVSRGQKFYLAHRSHAYQYASRKHGSHLPVTLAVAGINLFWLLPIALLVAFDHLDGALGVLIAYTPLVAVAYRYKAGDGAAQEV